MKVILPADWRSKPKVEWPWDHRISREWVKELWKAIDFSSSTTDITTKRELSELPLIPCGDELVRVDLAEQVMQPQRKGKGEKEDENMKISPKKEVKRAGSGDTPIARMNSGEYTALDAALALLGSIGVSVSDPSFQSRVLSPKMSSLTGEGIVNALVALPKGWEKNINKEGALALLDLIARDTTEFSESKKAQLANLPIFEYDDGHLRPLPAPDVRWTRPKYHTDTVNAAIRGGRKEGRGASTNTTTITTTTSSSSTGVSTTFLVPPSKICVPLFADLGIEEMPRAAFYTNFLLTPFESWRAHPVEFRVKMLNEIKRDYETIRTESIETRRREEMIAQEQRLGPIFAKRAQKMAALSSTDIITVASTNRATKAAKKLPLNTILRRTSSGTGSRPERSGSGSGSGPGSGSGSAAQAQAQADMQGDNLENLATFARWFATAPIFWTTGNKWVALVEMADPRDRLFCEFFSENLVALELRGLEWITWLERAGMSGRISRQSILECALQVHNEALSFDPRDINQCESLRKRSRFVVQSFLENLNELLLKNETDLPPQEWMRQMSELCLLEPRFSPPASIVLSEHFDPTKVVSRSMRDLIIRWRKYYRPGNFEECPLTLFPFRGNYVHFSRKTEFFSSMYCGSWSQVMILSSSEGISTYQLTKVEDLGTVDILTFPSIIEHIKLLASLPFEVLKNWHEQGFVESEGYPMKKMFHHAYAYLFVRMELHTMSNRSLDSLDSLDIQLKRLIGDFPFLLLDEKRLNLSARAWQWPTFVSPSQLFKQMKVDVPPYAFRVGNCLSEVGYHASGLISALRLSDLPTFDQCLAWANTFYQHYASRGQVLQDQNLNTALGFIEMGYQASFDSIYGGDDNLTLPPLHESLRFPTPDRHGRFHNPQKLVFDDAPWLKERVDYDKLPLIHGNIARKIAIWLGAQPMSLAICEVPAQVERLDDSSIPSFIMEKLTLWTRNLKSSGFRASVRRAGQHNQNKKGGDSNNQFKNDEVTRRLAALAGAKVEAASNISSRFTIPTIDNLDVTLKNEGSPALLSFGHGVRQPIMYLLLENDAQGIKEGEISVRRGWTRLILPRLALELDKYLGKSFIEPHLYRDLIQVDDLQEMGEVLDAWQIPSAELDLDCGFRYIGAKPVILEPGEVKIGERVIIPIYQAGAGALASLDDGEDSTCIFWHAKIVALQADGSVLVSVSADGEAESISPNQLFHPSKAADRFAKAEEDSLLAEFSEFKLEDEEEGDGGGERKKAQHRKTHGPGAGAGASAGASASAGAATAGVKVEDVEEEEEDEGSGPRVHREKYVASDGFEASELAARKALAERDAIRLAQPRENEPEGIDSYLALKGKQGIKKGETPISEMVKGVNSYNRVSAGYDLLRIGNFTDQVGDIPDIAFFHQRKTVFQIYDEARYKRQTLVKQCCGALRDVCDRVFNVDPARVTLFWEPGAASRFVKQRLLFNIVEIEERAKSEGLVDVRTDPFVYCHFYGLCVHKLAHFFDVVHGTRHDFFMSEYRALYTTQWVQLLLARGFDPEKVEKQYPAKLWEVVN